MNIPNSLKLLHNRLINDSTNTLLKCTYLKKFKQKWQTLSKKK